MTEKLIISNLQLLPERMKKEVLDFILFLQQKTNEEKKVENVKRKFDSVPGKYILSPDFDETPEDFNKYLI